MLLLLPLLLSLPALLFADSIILLNDCKRTSERCEAKKDCAIFANVDRFCSLGEEQPSGPSKTDEGISVTETENGTMISWTGTKVKGNGTESSSLTAESVWQRLVRKRRQVKGQVVNCTCTPVRREKRSSSDFNGNTSLECVSGFRPTTSSVHLDEKIVRKCAETCSGDPTCDSFAIFEEESKGCAFIKGEEEHEEDGVVYKKC